MRKKLIACAVCLLLVISGCQKVSPKISVTVYPVQYLLERIGGEVIEVSNISLEETIQTTTVKDDYKETLEESNALFYVSDLEPYFDVYGENIRSSKVNLVNAAGNGVQYAFQRYAKTELHGESVEVKTPYYEGSVFEHIDMYKSDPMVWMDPIDFISAAEIVRDYLIEQYPEHENTFVENFAKLEYDLTALDVAYQQLWDVDRPIAFVSMTPSFGAWQRSYGIQVYPVCLSKYGALPSEEQLEIIKERIIDDGVRYIVHEQNLNEEMENLFVQLETELGLQRVELSNLTSLSEEEASLHKDYLTIMYDNLTVLEEMGTY